MLTGFQAWLGKWTVESGNSSESVTAHLAVSMLILAATIFIFVRSRYAVGLPRSGASQRTTLLVAFAAASVYVLMLFGSNVTVNAASLVFPDWPLFDGQLIPTWNDDPAAAQLQMHHFAHRIVAVVVGLIMLWATRGHLARGSRCRRRSRPLGDRQPALRPGGHRRRAVRRAGRGRCLPDLVHAGGLGRLACTWPWAAPSGA